MQKKSSKKQLQELLHLSNVFKQKKKKKKKKKKGEQKTKKQQLPQIDILFQFIISIKLLKEK